MDCFVALLLAMTIHVMAGHSRPKDGVASARLCPAIHVLRAVIQKKTWMPGTRPGMTMSSRYRFVSPRI
jgi:hypothetical protein